MSTYLSSWGIRYVMPTLQQQAEVAVITAATDIQNEDAGTANHANRLAWSNWAIKNSTVAANAFFWPVAMNPTIQASVQEDPSGASVKDSDIQFVVNSNLDAVIADFVANPPEGVKLPT